MFAALITGLALMDMLESENTLASVYILTARIPFTVATHMFPSSSNTTLEIGLLSTYASFQLNF